MEEHKELGVTDKEQEKRDLEKERQPRSDLKDLPLLQSFAAKKSYANTKFRILSILCHKFMKPLLDQYSERRGHKAEDETT